MSIEYEAKVAKILSRSTRMRRAVKFMVWSSTVSSSSLGVVKIVNKIVKNTKILTKDLIRVSSNIPLLLPAAAVAPDDLTA